MVCEAGWAVRGAGADARRSCRAGRRGGGGLGGGATLYIAGSFGRFTTADGTVHNVTGVGEWVAEAKGGLGTIKPLGLGLSLPNEGVALDYHRHAPDADSRRFVAETVREYEMALRDQLGR